MDHISSSSNSPSHVSVPPTDARDASHPQQQQPQPPTQPAIPAAAPPPPPASPAPPPSRVNGNPQPPPAELALILSTVLQENEGLKHELHATKRRADRLDYLLNVISASQQESSPPSPPVSSLPKPALKAILDLEAKLEAERAAHLDADARLQASQMLGPISIASSSTQSSAPQTPAPASPMPSVTAPQSSPSTGPLLAPPPHPLPPTTPPSKTSTITSRITPRPRPRLRVTRSTPPPSQHAAPLRVVAFSSPFRCCLRCRSPLRRSPAPAASARATTPQATLGHPPSGIAVPAIMTTSVFPSYISLPPSAHPPSPDRPISHC